MLLLGCADLTAPGYAAALRAPVSGDGLESHPCVLVKMDTRHSQTNTHIGRLQCLGSLSSCSATQAKNPLMTLL